MLRNTNFIILINDFYLDIFMDKKFLRIALLLSIFTILYNLAEGIFSVFFGAKDETLALFGFGIDSFVEVISGLGIMHMVLRMKYSDVKERDNFEKTALKITGTGFYVLTAGLAAGSVLNLFTGAKPQTTLAGIIISIISIATMYWLLKSKLKVGRALKSDAIIADANCTKTCFYLSLILLASSLLFQLTGLGFIDILGSLGIAYYSFNEGRESFEKIKTGSLMCDCDEECETEHK